MFSIGGVTGGALQLATTVPGFLENAKTINDRLHLFFLSAGTDQPGYPEHLKLVDVLKMNGIQHEWHSLPGLEQKIYRHSLFEMLPELFQPVRR